MFGKYYQNSIPLNRVALTGFLIGFCEDTPTLLLFLTSVSGGQLNDDDHCFHLSELNLKKYACALKRTARAVAGNSIKENKALEMFLHVLPMASQKKMLRLLLQIVVALV